MYTEFGKVLRHIRLDNYENMKDMADKLDVSSAFLSAVECGKKPIPNKWLEKLISIYSLHQELIEELENAIDLSRNQIEISLEDLNDNQTEISLMFARNIKNIKPDDLELLKRLLMQENVK